MALVDGYARPELLAEPDWLWARRDDPNLRIVDCGKPEAYARAHVLGAVRLQYEGGPAGVPEQWLKNPEDPAHVMTPAAFADVMGRLGVSDETTVVAYDDFNGTWATRLWWVLNYYGHAQARVLHGGWQRWLEEGRPATFRETVPERGRFTPRPNEGMRVRLDELRARHAEPGVRVVNVLPPEMYRGTDNPFGNKRVGHVPGSVNVPIERFFADQATHVLKPAAELRAVLAEARLSPEHETIVHCQAGVRTTMGVFVASLLGWDRVRAYEASLAEWANRGDTPLVTGEA